VSSLVVKFLLKSGVWLSLALVSGDSDEELAVVVLVVVVVAACVALADKKPNVTEGAICVSMAETANVLQVAVDVAEELEVVQIIILKNVD
jgi:acid phosphatase class B